MDAPQWRVGGNQLVRLLLLLPRLVLNIQHVRTLGPGLQAPGSPGIRTTAEYALEKE